MDLFNLPLEVLALIISYLLDLRDVSAFSQTSKFSQQLIYDNLKVLSTPKLVQVGFRFLEKYHRLEKLENIQCCISHDKDVLTIEKMRCLREASFIFWGRGPDSYSRFVSFCKKKQLLSNIAKGNFSLAFLSCDGVIDMIIVEGGLAFKPSEITVRGRPFKVNWKIGQQHLKFLGATQLLHFGEKDFSNIDQNLIQIGRIYPEYPNSKLVYLNHYIRGFLEEADFGLSDPSRPPGEDNPPLKSLLPITLGGISHPNIISNLISIYNSYVKRSVFVQSGQLYLKSEKLLEKYFKPILTLHLRDINNCRGLTSITNKTEEYFKCPWDFGLIQKLHNNYGAINCGQGKRRYDCQDFNNLSQTMKTVRMLVESPHKSLLENEHKKIVNTLTKYYNLGQLNRGYYLSDGRCIKLNSR